MKIWNSSQQEETKLQTLGRMRSNSSQQELMEVQTIGLMRSYQQEELKIKPQLRKLQVKCPSHWTQEHTIHVEVNGATEDPDVSEQSENEEQDPLESTVNSEDVVDPVLPVMRENSVNTVDDPLVSTAVTEVSNALVVEVSESSIVEDNEVSRTAVESLAVSTTLQEEVQTPEDLNTEVEALLDSTIPIEEVQTIEDLNTVVEVSEIPMYLPVVSQEVMELTRVDPSKSEVVEEVSTCQINVVSANLSKVSDTPENAEVVSSHIMNDNTRTTTVSKVSEIKSNEVRRNSDVVIKGIDEMLDVVADITANLTMEKKTQGMDTTDARILDTSRKRTPVRKSDASSRSGPGIEPTPPPPPPPHNG